MSEDLIGLLVILVTVIANGICEKQSLVRRSGSKVRISQEEVGRGQLEVDQEAVGLLLDEVEQLGDSNEKFS